MKAILARSYGPADVLKCEEVDKPVPGPDEVLLRVRAAAVNPLDAHLSRGTPLVGRLAFGLLRPKDPRVGRDVAGVVEAVGGNVTRFKPRDEVFGACRGAFAEYACASESNVANKPATVTFEQAASLPIAAITALQGLRDNGKIKAGQNVLINGAAGGVGTFAVQIAKWSGAEVTGVCSTRNLELVRSIGADRVLDYTQEDFTKSGQHYDLIFDVIGNHSFRSCRRVMNVNGIFVSAGGGGPDGQRIGRWLTRVIAEVLLSKFTKQKLVMCMAVLRSEDLTTIGELVASGKVKPVIERRYNLNEVPEAIRHLKEGHARGKIVIVVE